MTSPPSPSPAPPSAPRGQIIVNVFGRTDVGRVREHNEDSFVVADLTTGNATLLPEVRTHAVGERGTLFMVADGMGGAAAGEIASQMAVDIILEELQERWVSAPTRDPEAFATALRAATLVANTRINQFAAEHPEYRGMGTTATVAALLDDTLYVSQVGDSRAYLVRGGVARQITKDQSLMQRLIEAGEITEEEAEQSDRRNIILQALGPEVQIRTDITHQQVRRGDTLILCSDGLSGQVRLEEIAHAAANGSDPMQVCKELIDLANDNGGPDNITVIAARFEGEGLVPPSDADEVRHRVFRLADDDQTPTIPVERYIARRTSPTPPKQRAADGERSRADRAYIVAFLLTLIILGAAALLAMRAVRSYGKGDAAPSTRPASPPATSPPAARPPAATPPAATPPAATPSP